MNRQHDALLRWYDSEGRDLPWRVKNGKAANPYHVWLSEIMLQQTTVVTVIPYFLSFIQRWPTLDDLALAPLDDILHEWQGLGYYARARNLHACAKVLAQEYNGFFPHTSEELIKLPGIGSYTSKAIAAIAFNESTLPVDGNIARILTRLYAISLPLPKGMPEVQKAAQIFTPKVRPGDFAQAMMDIGSSICTPRIPICEKCPFNKDCKAYTLGITAEIPFKTIKSARPKKYAIAYIFKREDGAILFRKRPEKGLLGGMMEIPTSEWQDKELENEEDMAKNAPIKHNWKLITPKIKHIFTHFELDVKICYGILSFDKAKTLEGEWIFPHQISSYALPTLFKKIIETALK